MGTQSDLRGDAAALVEISRFGEAPVPESDAKKLATTLGCEAYVETSSLTQRNLKEVFDEAIVAGIKGRRMKREREAREAARAEGRGRAGCVNCVIL